MTLYPERGVQAKIKFASSIFFTKLNLL